MGSLLGVLFLVYILSAIVVCDVCKLYHDTCTYGIIFVQIHSYIRAYVTYIQYMVTLCTYVHAYLHLCMIVLRNVVALFVVG